MRSLLETKRADLPGKGIEVVEVAAALFAP
jgi:hypothetical protein